MDAYVEQAAINAPTYVSSEELDAALALLRDDVDADYAFFDGLFAAEGDDNGDASDTTECSTVSQKVPSSSYGQSTRNERRRQRWRSLPAESPANPELRVVIRLPAPLLMPRGSNCTAADATATETLSRAWREVAITQKRERQAAEKENAALRELLQMHTQTAQKIVKLTRKASELARSFPPRDEMVAYLGPTMPLSQIQEELELLVLGADVVLSSGAFASEEQQFREINYRRVATATGDAIQLELDLAWVLPFPVEVVAQAVWIQLSRTTPKDKVYSITDVHNDPELIVTQAVAGPKESDGKAAIIHTQIATRCLPAAQDGSILLVMATHARFVTESNVWVGSSEGEGYVRVSPVSDLSTTTSMSTTKAPLSRVEFCRRSRAQPPAESKLSPAERATWINVAISGPMRGSDQRVDSMVQELENLLLTPSGNGPGRDGTVA